MRAEREKTSRIRAESSDANRMRQAIYSLQQILLNSAISSAFSAEDALFQIFLLCSNRRRIGRKGGRSRAHGK
jgi:hypothetical protein